MPEPDAGSARAPAGVRRRRPRARRAAAGLAPAVVLTGTTTALSIARSLTDAGVEVHVLDVPDAPARHSRLRRTFVPLTADDMQSQMLGWLRAGPHGAVVLAGGDEGLELIARNRAELRSLGYLPMEAADDVTLAMLDKDATHALAREHGIPVAGARPLRTRADVDAVIGELAFPMVLKPVRSHVFARVPGAGAKVVTVADADELRSRVHELSSFGVELSVIEVITGPDDEYVSYYSYLDGDGRSMLQLTKRKLRQYPPRFGIGTYHATSHDPEVAALGLRFFQAVGLRGLGNVEFKRDARDGQLKLIECNARFTMSNELIRRAGMDLALFSYNRLTGRPLPRMDGYRDDMRLWDPARDARAMLAYRRSGELSAAAWAESLMHPQCFPVARWDDPVPSAVRHGRVLARRVAEPAGAALAGSVGERARRAVTSDRRGRALTARLDLARAAGPGYVWRRLRAERGGPGLGEGARNRLYERIWREAADAAGARVRPLSGGLVEVTRDGVGTRIFQQVVALDDPVTLRVALDKVLVHELLGAAGVPVPEHLVFDVREPDSAVAFLAAASGPCVVKPAAGTGGGHGTTAGVRHPGELRRACAHAATGTDRLLIERQVAGDVYRLLLLDGELLDVVRGRPPSLTGDGRSTIGQLVEAETRRRVLADGAAGLSRLGISLDMVMTLGRSGLGLGSVLPAGRACPVGTITNGNSAADNGTYRGPLAPEVVAAARRAAAEVGLRLAGVDLITTDPSRALDETGGIVAEVNGNPGLHHHYLVADADAATRVAIPVLERVLSEAEPLGGSPWTTADSV